MELLVKIRKEKFLGKGKIVQKLPEDRMEWVCYKLILIFIIIISCAFHISL